MWRCWHRDPGSASPIGRRRLNECPLGAAALAGTSFPIDRHATAAALGFDRPAANSLDAVSDRDFALEFLSAASLCAVHLSRLAEEIVTWCSAPRSASCACRTRSPPGQFDHAAEAQSGRGGTGAGQDRAASWATLVALLMVMKGLPLAYAKDTQEDKEPVFDSRRRAWPVALRP